MIDTSHALATTSTRCPKLRRNAGVARRRRMIPRVERRASIQDWCNTIEGDLRRLAQTGVRHPLVEQHPAGEQGCRRFEKRVGAVTGQDVGPAVLRGPLSLLPRADLKDSAPSGSYTKRLRKGRLGRRILPDRVLGERSVARAGSPRPHPAAAAWVLVIPPQMEAQHRHASKAGGKTTRSRLVLPQHAAAGPAPVDAGQRPRGTANDEEPSPLGR